MHIYIYICIYNYMTSRQRFRDVKPENILLTKAAPICIRLADFGVATVASPTDLR